MGNYVVKPLSADTWDAFARLVERHNGVFGGCWCTWFHTFHAEKTFTAEGNRAFKERLVKMTGHTLPWSSTATRRLPGPSTALLQNCRTSTTARSTRRPSTSCPTTGSRAFSWTRSTDEKA